MEEEEEEEVIQSDTKTHPEKRGEGRNIPPLLQEGGTHADAGNWP